jgi:hypothetical protein
MGKKFNNCEPYYNQEVTFNYDGEELTWFGDYGVRTLGEEPDRDYPGDQENEIEILHTDKIEAWSDHKENWILIDPTPSILAELEFAIEKSI